MSDRDDAPLHHFIFLIAGVVAVVLLVNELIGLHRRIEALESLPASSPSVGE
jgi:hypothetical protein